MKITALSIEQDHQNQATKTWFEVDRDVYGISSSGGDKTLLDIEGYPIDLVNDHDGILEVLAPLHDAIAEEFCGEDKAIPKDWQAA